MSDPPLVPAEVVLTWIGDLPQPVAVTGATGFIGSHLVDTLCAAGLRPRVLVRDPERPRWIADRPVEWVPGSLEDSTSLARLVSGAGTVFHLAGVVTADRSDAFDHGNREGTGRLLEAVREWAPGARFVLVSSLAAVGPSRERDGVSPETEPAPVSDYGRSKLAAEEAIRGWGGDGWWTIVRPPAVYGPRDTGVYEFFRMVRRGFALIPAGERWITVMHAADAVRGLLAAASSDRPRRIYHLGEVDPYRVDEMISLLAAADDRPVRIIRVPETVVSGMGAMAGSMRRLGLMRGALTRDKAREIVARHWSARSSDSLDALGLDITVRFAEGARATWAWYRSQGWLS